MEDKNTPKSKFAFTKTNYILLIVGLFVIFLGFVLMTGPGTTETNFEESIFSVRRIKIAPVTCFIGYIFLIFAILYKKKESK